MTFPSSASVSTHCRQTWRAAAFTVHGQSCGITEAVGTDAGSIITVADSGLCSAPSAPNAHLCLHSASGDLLDSDNETCFCVCQSPMHHLCHTQLIDNLCRVSQMRLSFYRRRSHDVLLMSCIAGPVIKRLTSWLWIN